MRRFSVIVLLSITISLSFANKTATVYFEEDIPVTYRNSPNFHLSSGFQITPTKKPNSQLSPESWRNWPVLPLFSDKALVILKKSLENPNLDSHAISRVGDCQFTTDTFLAGYVKGVYSVPQGYKETSHFFRESFVRDSVTAANGLGINSVLNPIFGLAAGNSQCLINETPLVCELRTRHPAVVLVAMGTNWKPYAELTFEKNLREVVDIILASGALPILATKADNIEEDWTLNLAIARVAYDYELPLINIWSAVQDLPNHGLSAPANEYLTADAWMVRNDVWLKTLEQVRMVLDD
ncbi:MAG: hypothetical protein C0410_07795 [Anaerolinea sp.]|nr:hypothetical protein [Anaerolinea sp.]